MVIFDPATTQVITDSAVQNSHYLLLHLLAAMIPLFVGAYIAAVGAEFFKTMLSSASYRTHKTIRSG